MCTVLVATASVTAAPVVERAQARRVSVAGNRDCCRHVAASGAPVMRNGGGGTLPEHPGHRPASGQTPPSAANGGTTGERTTRGPSLRSTTPRRARCARRRRQGRRRPGHPVIPDASCHPGGFAAIRLDRAVRTMVIAATNQRIPPRRASYGSDTEEPAPREQSIAGDSFQADGPCDPMSHTRPPCPGIPAPRPPRRGLRAAADDGRT